MTGGHNADRRHSDPEHGGLSSGEKATITKQVHLGVNPEDVHLQKHPEHDKAAQEYAKEVAAREAEEPHGKGQHHASHARGELSGAEKAAVTRAVKAEHSLEDLPFVQNHPKKLAHAQEYAEEVKEKEGMK
ncbi:hypothetical protein D9Q98_003279 [Chlorella vulgaris]|uniref:Uncharacterized protein n=1 Tax=Chlorella vulgaris TaxID=3077 RepID=A0A9D4TSK6_CHLVU|nr:hypothetical protein D9Q98_003279 [Chlorella vulgaris]